MSALRPRRILAILQRDLQLQLHGRQRWIIFGILGALLGPLAFAPNGEEVVLQGTHMVRGDVPEVVLQVEGTEVVEQGRRARLALWFQETDDALLLHGGQVPRSIREALDPLDAMPETYLWREDRWPTRGLLLALLAASTLTGSLAQSIPGERSDRTLIALRAASVTPWEIVAGKWLAWGGFGALGALVASVGSVVAGRLDLGWWLVAIPVPSLTAAALGLYLVRTAQDVVGGSAVALRTMPVVLGGTGIASLLMVPDHPVLAALVPAGGALIACGGMFDGPLLVFVAMASSLIPTAWMLHRVALDLDPPPHGEARGTVAATLEATALLFGWWACVGSAGLYDAAGATARAHQLSPEWSLTAGAVFLAVAWSMSALRRDAPRRHVSTSPIQRLGAIVLAIAGLALVPVGVARLMGPGPVVDLSTRLGPEALTDASLGVTLLLVGLQEGIVRGRLQAMGGTALSVVVWMVVFQPSDPVHGLLSGLALSGLATLTGDWRPGAVVRLLLLWTGTGSLLASAGAATSGTGVLAVLVLAGWAASTAVETRRP